MTPCKSIVATVMTAVLWSAPALADPIDDVQKKIAAAAEKIKSMTADITMNMDMVHEQMTMKMSGNGTLEFMRKGSAHLSRSEMTTSMDMGGGMPSMKSQVLTVTDGEYTYTLSEQMGQQMGTKMRIDPASQQVPSEKMFDTMRERYTLKLLPDETIDGKQTYPIEATPKVADGQTGKSVFHFDQKTGMMVKMVTFGPDGSKPMQTTTITQIKTDVDIPADRFVFKAPPGVQIHDMTSGS